MNADLRDPPRLRDDPTFRGETGCDLADETFAVGGYDLTRGRARLLAAIAALPPTGTGPETDGDAAPPDAAPPGPAGRTGASGVMSGGTAAVISTAVAALVTAAVWLSSPAPTAPPPGASALPTAISAAPAPGPVVPALSLGIEPHSEAPPARGSAPRPIAAHPAAPPIVAPSPAPAPPVVDPLASLPTGPSAPATAPPLPSALQADYQAFLAGDARLKESDWRGARDGFEAYLRRFPHGAMEPEARFGLLVAVFELGDAAAGEAQAQLLQDRPEFSSRRTEILRLRAESLVSLGRCDEALTLADALASKDAAEVRRVCRARRREGP